MANEPKNLYDLEDYFRYSIAGGPWQFIDEPLGWDAATVKLTRDKETWGLNYEFVEGEKVNLLFAWGPGGGEALLAAYKITGGDTAVDFEYGYGQNGAAHVQFAGVLNFNYLNENEDGVEVTVEKTLFQGLLRTRYETKVALNTDKTLDGAAVVPLVPMRMRLHSKRIVKYGRAEKTDSPAAMVPPTTTLPGRIFYIQPDTTTVSKAEVEELQSMPLAITAVTAQSESRFQFIAVEAGRIRFRWRFKYDLRTQPAAVLSVAIIGDWYLTPQIQVYRAGVQVNLYAPPAAQISGFEMGHVKIFSHDFLVEWASDLLINDEVYFNVKLEVSHNGLRLFTAQAFESFVEVDQETVAPPSFTNGFTILPAMNRIVEAVTGQANRVVSAFFGPGGCGAKYAITNGFQIRNFDIANRPPNLSLKDVWEGSAPLWNLAWQYVRTGGLDVLRVEPLPTFFKAANYYVFRGISDYEEEHAQDVTWNEVEVGFAKYANDEQNSLDEFNTLQTWLTPVRTFKNKLLRKSTWIGSGYSIEKMRREQFKEKPSDSTTGDDDIFVIAFIEERKHRDVSYNFAGVTVVIGKQVNMLQGETFRIVKNGGGGANDATVFTVVTAATQTGQDTYTVTPAPVAESGTGEVEIFIAMPEAEKNEAFNHVNNLISPDSAYNLRISPKHILFNHSELLNVGLAQKADTDEFKLTDVKQNGELETQFNPAAPCIRMDANPLFKERGSFALSEFNSRRRLFLPINCKFKAPMNYDDFIYIKERACGETGTADDFGTVIFPDRLGVQWFGYIWSMEYDPVKQQVTVLMRKKQKV